MKTTPGSPIVFFVASEAEGSFAPSLGLSTRSCLAGLTHAEQRAFPASRVLQSMWVGAPGLRKPDWLVPAWACGPRSLAGVP